LTPLMGYYLMSGSSVRMQQTLWLRFPAVRPIFNWMHPYNL